MRAVALLAIVLGSLGSAAPARAERLVGIQEAPLRVLVLDFKSKDKGIDAALLETVGGLVAARLAEHERFDVISGQELRRLVELEGDKQAMGCETDASCLAEIANAMGARLIVMGQLGKLGSLIVLNLSLYDSDEGRTVARASVRADSLDALPDALEPELDEMVRRFLGVSSSGAASSGAASSGASSSGGDSSGVASPGDAASASTGAPSAGTTGLGPDAVRMGLAAGAAGGGALLGFGLGVVTHVLTSQGLPLADLSSPEMVINAALYPALLSYLGGALGAVFFCDLALGVHVVGGAAAIAAAATYLAVGAGMVLAGAPKNDGLVVGANVLAATAGTAAAAIAAPFFLAPVEE